MRRSRLVATATLMLLAACARPDATNPRRSPDPPRREGWRVIADAGLSPRYGHAAAWTGREMLIWGGVGPQTNDALEHSTLEDGAAYYPQRDEWRRLPRAPIPGGSGYSAVWTGTEMIVWGAPQWGVNDAHGAVYSPAADAWRRIAPSPLSPRVGHLAVWTGAEMIVWGGALTATEREDYDGLGAAYDPATGTWRMLPRGPLPAGYDAMGAWTGDEVLVLATPMGDPPPNRPKQPGAAAYVPATDRWRSVAQPLHAAWVSPPAPFLDGKLFILSDWGTVDGGEVDPLDRPYDTGGIYDVAADAWEPHAYPKRIPYRQTWETVATSDEIVMNELAYHPASDSWRRLPRFPLEARLGPSLVWTGRELIVWGGALQGDWEPPRVLNDGAAYTPPPR